MYTEDTLLTYGKYKGKMIKEIPKDYLVNVHITGGEEHAALKEYIEANLDKFPGLTMLSWFNKKKDVTVQFICDKRTYPTKKSAMDSIIKPKSKQQKKKPIRAYECEKCSGWHLTSMPIETFKSIKNV